MPGSCLNPSIQRTQGLKDRVVRSLARDYLFFLSSRVLEFLSSQNSMSLKKILKVTGTCVPAAGDDVDTDRIIPARYLKCVTFEGLGEFLFYDVRFDENGRPKNFPLNSKFASPAA